MLYCSIRRYSGVDLKMRMLTADWSPQFYHCSSSVVPGLMHKDSSYFRIFYQLQKHPRCCSVTDKLPSSFIIHLIAFKIYFFQIPPSVPQNVKNWLFLPRNTFFKLSHHNRRSHCVLWVVWDSSSRKLLPGLGVGVDQCFKCWWSTISYREVEVLAKYKLLFWWNIFCHFRGDNWLKVISARQ